MGRLDRTLGRILNRHTYLVTLQRRAAFLPFDQSVQKTVQSTGVLTELPSAVGARRRDNIDQHEASET